LPKERYSIQSIVWLERYDGLTHEFFETLSALSTDEMDDLASYILNERKTSIEELKDLPKITNRNLSSKLKGRGIFAAKEWVQRGKS
jgi:hypothetical protein